MNAGIKGGLIGGALIASACFAAFSIYNRYYDPGTNSTSSSDNPESADKPPSIPFMEPTIKASPENTFENSCSGLEDYFNSRAGEFAHHTIASGFKNSTFQDGVANAKASQKFLESELGKGPNSHLFAGDGIPLYFCKGGTISVYGPSFLKVCDAGTIQWKQGEGLRWSAPKCETMPPQPVPG